MDGISERMSSPLLSADVVSPRVYGLILDSKPLARRLLPQGLIGSPYEILDYRATLVLTDAKGRLAIFRRTQRVRFLQDGVSAILDHLWGDGVMLTDYRHTAGRIGKSFKDQGTRHLVIDFKRPMARGETLTFVVERTAMEGFAESDEWLETTIDHPIAHFGQKIIFPKERPCQKAELTVGGQFAPLEPIILADGRTLLEVAVAHPSADTPHTVRWHW